MIHELGDPHEFELVAVSVCITSLDPSVDVTFELTYYGCVGKYHYFIRDDKLDRKF